MVKYHVTYFNGKYHLLHIVNGKYHLLHIFNGKYYLLHIDITLMINTTCYILLIVNNMLHISKY